MKGNNVAIIGFEPGKEIDVAEQAVLDDFGITTADFARGQGRQNIEVAKHQTRLPESADQVLALLMVDRRLAADRRIDLGQDGCRDLDEVDTAHIDGAGKARQVADDAAAERDDDVLAVEAGLQHGVQHELQAVIGFRLFAGRHDNRLDAVA